MKTVAYVKCTCVHEQQDALHGKGIRLMNALKTKDPKDPRREVRCTVCSKIHTIDVGRMK